MTRKFVKRSKFLPLFWWNMQVFPWFTRKKQQKRAKTLATTQKRTHKKANSWKKATRQIVLPNWSRTCFTPQGWCARMQALSVSCIRRLQIKNIKLHIVTDIKVNFNSMLGFRISLFGWGDGYFIILKKWRHLIAGHKSLQRWPIQLRYGPKLACLLVLLVLFV